MVRAPGWPGVVHGSSEAAAAFCAKSACEKASSNSLTLGWGPSAEATCAKRRAAEGCAPAEPDELEAKKARGACGCGRKAGPTDFFAAGFLAPEDARFFFGIVVAAVGSLSTEYEQQFFVDDQWSIAISSGDSTNHEPQARAVVHVASPWSGMAP